MKLLVCIKQVPDMESRFTVNGSGEWYDESDLAWQMNEYDEFAVEQAVLLKEQLGGLPDITALSVGPDRVAEVIRKALAMGCDRGVHVRDPDASARDPWQMAGIIAEFAGGNAFELIFTGMQSKDRGSAQVGVTIAERLGYPCTTTVVGFAYDSGTVTAKRELEGGVKGVVKMKTPALVTCQMGLNTPRYPTLPNIMKSKKKEIGVIRVAELLKEEPLTVTAGFRSPARKTGGTVLEGEVRIVVDQLVDLLKGKALLNLS